MSNHYHLILRPSDNRFSTMMQGINDAFARYINRTRNRRGYVFFDRFKSVPTRDQHYISQLLLYIHANPLRANIVKSTSELSKYRWSSHHSYCTGATNQFPWLNTTYIMNIFNQRASGVYNIQAFFFCFFD